MFRGKETGNIITRRISAAILALVLVITSVNVDWNVLRASAEWGTYEPVASGTILAYKFTVQNTSVIKDASIRVKGTNGDTITATLVGVYKNVTNTPIDGVDMNAAVTAENATIDTSAPGEGAQIFSFDLSSPKIVLAPTENVSILIKVESNSGSQISVNSNAGDLDGFMSQNVNDKSLWYMFGQSIEVHYDSATAGELDAVTITHNIPTVKTTIGGQQVDQPVINLSVGQTFEIQAEVPAGYRRHIDYIPQDGQTVYTFDRPGVIVAGANGGSADLTIGRLEDGVTPVSVIVNVIDVTADPGPYTYNGAPVSPTINPVMGTEITQPQASDFTISNPGTNAGHYTVDVIGKSDKYPGYATTVDYVIDPIDLSATGNVITLDLNKFYVDPSTNQVTSDSKITYNGKDYVYGTDFSATAVFNKTKTEADPNGNYVYDVTITGKGNFINSVTKEITETVNKSALKLKDIYTVTLNQSEIIWDGVTNPLTNPSLTFVNKITGTTVNGIPGDVALNYTNNTEIGTATVTITSSVYDVNPVDGDLSSGPIVLNYLIKQKIDSTTVDIELEKPSYVEELVNGAYVEKRPTVKVKYKTGAHADEEIDSTNYTVRYSNNERAGVATVTVVANPGTLYSGSASTTFTILPDIRRNAWISIGGVQNPQNPNPDDYAKASNNFLSSYTATYTGNVIQIQDSQIEILVDGVVLDHKYYSVDRKGDGVNSAGIVDGKAGVDVGIGNGSVLIKTSPEYGEQTIRVYFTITPCELRDVSIVPVNSEEYSNARIYTGKEIKLHETPEYTQENKAFEFRVVGKNGKDVDESQYTLEYRDNINAGTATLIAKGKDGSNYTGSASVGFEIKPYNISGSKFTIDPIGNQSFIGAKVPVTPVPVMYFDGNPVTDTKAFKFDYTNNETISTSAKPASVTITGGGNFEGTRKVNFNIVSKSITNSSVTFAVGGNDPVTATSGRIDSSLKLQYDGGRQVPDLVIRDNGVKLTQGVDYNIRPANNININGGSSANPPSLTVVGIGNYGNSSGNTVVITFTIGPRDINTTGVGIAIAPDTYKVTVTDTGNKARLTLIEGTDYEVKITGRDNDVEWDGKTSGDYKVVVTGIGNYYGDTSKNPQYFSKGKNVKDLKVTLINPILSSSNTAELSASATASTQHFQYIGGNRPFVKIEKEIVEPGGTRRELIESGIEYEFLNPDGTSAVDYFTDGDFIIRVAGSGEEYFGTYDFKYNEDVAVFSDTLTDTAKTPVQYRNDFTITVNGVSKKSENVTSPSTNYYVFEFPYMENTVLKDEEIPISVLFNPVNRCGVAGFEHKTLKSSSIEVTISGTLDLSQETTGSNTRELVITPTSESGFSGSKTIKYKVKKPSIDGALVTGINEEYTFKNEAFTPADFPNIVVTLEGKTLVRDKDYTVEVVPTITPVGSTTDVTRNGDIVAGAQVVIKGKGEYDASTEKVVTFKIMPKNIADSDVSIEVPAVVGKDTTAPEPAITFKNKKLTKTTDYTVSGNTTATVGDTTMTINGKGNYTGTVDKRYVVKENISTASVDGIDTVYQIDEQGRIVGKNNSKLLSSAAQGDVEVYFPGVNKYLGFGTDYTIKLVPDTFLPGSNRQVVIEGINNYTGSISKDNIKVVGKFSDVSGIEPRITYTGSPIPGPVVRFQGERLNENIDYTVTYKDSTGNVIVTGRVGVVAVGKYTAVVSGKTNSKYDGSEVTIEFNIVEKSMSSVTVEIKPEWDYTGSEIDASTTLRVRDGDNLLVEGRDYEIDGKTVSSNPLKQTDPGIYTFSITGKGNYVNDTKSATFTIIADINKYNFTTDAKAILITDNGEEAVKNVNTSLSTYEQATVTYNKPNTNPPADPAYTISFDGNLTPGSRTGRIVVKGEAPYFKGEKAIATNLPVYGKIEGARWMNAPTETEGGKPVFAYTGSLINPIATADLELNGTKLTTSNYASGGITATSTPVPAILGQDVGDYSVTLKGAGYYLGSKDIEYCIRYDLSGATVTLEPTSYTYDGTAREPKVTVKVRDKVFDNDPNTPALDITDWFDLSYSDNIAAGTASVTVSGATGKSVGTATKTFRINRTDVTSKIQLGITDADTAPNEFNYRGENVQPTISVSVDGIPLTPETNPAHNYTVTYPNQSKNVGTYKAIVELTGSYSGKKEIEYKIVPKTIVGATVTATDVEYTGKAAKPVITVTDNGNALVEGRDYKVEAISAVDAQNGVTVTVTGMNNYDSNTQAFGTFNILPIDISIPGKISVTGISKVYDGREVTNLQDLPGFSVSILGTPLSKSAYTAEFAASVTEPVLNANRYDFEIKPDSNNNISGTYTGTYVIEKKALSNASLTYDRNNADNKEYRSEVGFNTTPDSKGDRYVNRGILENPDFVNDSSENSEVTIDPTKLDLYDMAIDRELYKSSDISYPHVPEVEVVYSGNKAAGIASVIFRALPDSNYTGEISFRFKIGKDISGSEAGVTIDPTTYVYDGEAKMPQVTSFTYGVSTLTPGTDYTVDWEDNPVNVGTHYVYVRGNGKNYYGEIGKPYSITKRPKTYLYADFAEGALVEGYKWIYNGSPADPQIIVYDSGMDNKAIDPSEYTVTYRNNTSVGTAYYMVNINTSSNYDSGPMTNYAGGSNSFQIEASELDTADLEIRLSGTNPYTFTGRRITPVVSVYHNGTLIQPSNYTVEITNNILPGQAQVTVILKGNYEGYVSTTFDIVANLGNTQTVSVNAADRRWTGQAIDGSGIVAYLISNPVKKLTEGVDYEAEVTPVGGDWSTAVRAKAVLTGITSDYKGTRTVYFNLTKDLAPGKDPSDPGYVEPDKPDPLPDDPTPDNPTPGTGKDLNTSGITATVIAPVNGFTYNGMAFTPSVIVTDGSKTLTRGNSSSTTADYYVEYRNNINPGTAYVDIKGINAYRGTLTRSFLISNGSGTGSGTQGGTITIPGFSATASGTNSARLAWGGVSGVTSYTLTWRGSNGTTGSQTVAAGSTSATVNNLSPGVTYTFTLTAYGSGNSTGSAQAVCTTQASGSTGGTNNITPVSGLTGVSATTGTATLSWVNPQDGTYYEVYRSTSPSSYGSYIGSVVNGGTVRCVYSDRNSLVSGRTYYYWIRPYKYVNGSKILGSYSSTYIAITVR